MKRLISFVCIAALGLSGCVTTAGADAPAAASTSAPAMSIPLVEVRQGVFTGGQPAIEDWATLRKRGIRTVVNLRPMNEMGGRDEAKEVRAQGLRYIEVPVFTAQDIHVENAKKLKAALVAAGSEPALVHCASGNRTGGLFAVMAHKLEGVPEAEAIELGRKAGMKSTETRVREVLAAP